MDGIAALEQANSDNTQWVLMQSEVEVLRLQGAILSALGSPPPDDMPASLDEVRRWFNVLYSRVSMLEQSSVYAPLLGKADYQDDHLVLRHFLDENVDLIDSSDNKLLAALHDLVDDLGDEQRPVHRVGHELAALGGAFTGHLSLPFLTSRPWRHNGCGPACGSSRRLRRARRG